MRSMKRKNAGCGTSIALILCISIVGRQIHCFTPSQLSNVKGTSLIQPKGKLRHSRCISLAEFSRKEPTEEEAHKDGDDRSTPDASRRSLLLQSMLVATLTPLPALAGKPEVDPTGQLFSPKAQMLRGGSDAARGIEQQTSRAARRPLPGETIQSIYETRFLAYLTRFLLTFDPSAHAWWVQQGFEDSWVLQQTTSELERQAKFAEFAESVEVGLADYFVGPYGSYASVSAAKAGLLAAAPAASARPLDKAWNKESLLEKMGFAGDSKGDSSKSQTKKQPSTGNEEALARQGILNLYALLKARYKSVAAKRQMAILFSFISSPRLQPAAEIRSLLGEADNATVTKIELIKPPVVEDEADSRTSSRRGGGYSISDPPKVDMEPPPALGDEFQEARCSAIVKPTSRILRINVVDGGEGYSSPPAVTVRQSGARKSCEACAIMDREGHVESVLVLNPGFGFGKTGKGYIPPEVRIEPPKKRRVDDESSGKKVYRTARAVAELEYEIVGVNLVEGGNGYVMSEPPKITISPPPEDPDWYISPNDEFGRSGLPEDQKAFAEARVTDMIIGDEAGIGESYVGGSEIDRGILYRLHREPLELLPSTVRPLPRLTDDGKKSFYSIPSLPAPPRFLSVPSPRYRAYDPLFGGVGSVPVTKGASELSVSEYSRLALSGAVCTVIVRTALNPLELVKTKIQLKNDKELNELAYQFMKDRIRAGDGDESHKQPPSSAMVEPVANLTTSEDGSVALKTRETLGTVASEESESAQPTIGTMDVVKSIVKLRGPLALFQSADITFLASLVFGSFGFGATELFRRSFSAEFFTDDTGDGMSELVLLAAAALACVLTSAAAAPFEVLRVRSMGLVEAKPWKDVLQDFLEDNSRKQEESPATRPEKEEFRLVDVKPDDLLPLWGGFGPTVSRELPFAVTKFLIFDLIAKFLVAFVNSQAGQGAMPVQVGVGSLGLAISAFAGAIAGVGGALVSHPADLILTLTSASAKKTSDDGEEEKGEKPDWREVLQELLSREGGIANLFVGLPARSVFFFLVIGLQFFLYDYVKTLFQVGSDDLSLVLDVFYAVRQGLLE